MKYPVILLLLLISFAGKQAGAQTLNGDTIYVNAEAEVAVRFPSLPSFFNTVPSNAPYNFKTLGTGFTIIAKSENTAPAPLFVTEGSRSHRFVLAFKKDINYDNEAELDYDFSSTKKIDQHNKRKEAGTVKQDVTEVKPEKTKGDSRKDKKAKVEDERSGSGAYYSLLESGEQKMKQQLFGEAKVDFEKAKAMRPEDLLPSQRLEEVKIKLADKEKDVQLEKNKKYVAVTTAAKSDLDQKKYKEAEDGYKQALELKPNDLYATRQLDKISKLLNEENEKKDRLKLQEVYKGYIADGEKALKQNQLTAARIAFEQALVITPNDALAKSKLSSIDDKEKQLKQSEELESNYNTAVLEADKLFQAGDLANAKLAYSKALTLIKRAWPQEQIAEINKLVTDKAAKEVADKQALAIKTETEKKEKETEAVEKRYFNAVQSADKLYMDGELTKAKTAYTNALQIINRQWPKDQVILINKELAEQDLREKSEKQKLAIRLEKEKREKEAAALEAKYSAAIQTADNFFEAKNYASAKTAYANAMGIIKKPWPEEQVKKINKIEADMVAAEKAEKTRLAQEKIINTKYNSAIQSADAEYAKNNFIRARKLYLDASLVKPAEGHPKQRLNDIQATLERIAAEEKAKKERIAAEIELKKKYDIALSKAKSYYLKEDWDNAKLSYTEAAGLKPAEAEPQNQLKLINNKLAEIARVNELNERYEAKLLIADNLLIAKDYEKAVTAYKDALAVKATETYPNSQIKYIQAEIKEDLRLKEERDKMEAVRAEIEKENKYRELIAQGNKSVTDKDYSAAKQQYSDALKIQPESDYAKRRLEIVSYQLEKSKTVFEDKSVAKNDKPSRKDKAAKTNDLNVALVVPQKQTNSSFEFQANPIPYTAEELKARYPSFDFKSLPPEQPYNDAAVDSKENNSMFNEVLTDKPRLDISDKDNKIKLICQGINFEERSCYLKLLIQNNSDVDFLTGAMMLTWTRRSGNNIKLYPLYIYPAQLPIVKPGNEAVIIYVCKSYNIADGEKLKFELTDRPNKAKLVLNLKGSVYNEEFVR